MPVQNDLVFLSYAREDGASAARLFNELKEANVKVWFDQESLAPGANWKLEIRRNIRKSRYFIAPMSSTSVSKKGFVQSELREALEVLDQYPQNETYLIPARLDACEAPHDKLNDFQWVDFFPEWSKGAETLLRFFGVNSTPNPALGSGLAKREGIFAPTVRLDGIYQSKRVGDFDSCIRFYPDGLVIRTSTASSPDKIAEWFNREWVERENKQKGIYTISGSKIRFSTTSSAGTIELEGAIQGDNLILNSHSHINGYRGVYEYTFIQLNELAGPES